MGHAQLAAFLANPKSRYPDGRMPAIPLPRTPRATSPPSCCSGRSPRWPTCPRRAVRRRGSRPRQALRPVPRAGRAAEHSDQGRGDCRGPRFALDERAKKESPRIWPSPRATAIPRRSTSAVGDSNGPDVFAAIRATPTGPRRSRPRARRSAARIFR
jgi:hypothetical protein